MCFLSKMSRIKKLTLILFLNLRQFCDNYDIDFAMCADFVTSFFIKSDKQRRHASLLNDKYHNSDAVSVR